jgi:hypothetical protein
LFEAIQRPVADRYAQWCWDQIAAFFELYQENDPRIIKLFNRHLENHLPEYYGTTGSQAKLQAPKIYRQLKRFKRKLGLK